MKIIVSLGLALVLLQPAAASSEPAPHEHGHSAGVAPAGQHDAHAERARAIDLDALSGLVTHDGVPFRPVSVHGQAIAVVFGYTSCPDVCPTTLLSLSNQLAALGEDARRITVLFITVDPEQDTAANLKAYLSSFDPRIIGLTGQPVDIAAAAHEFQAFHEKIPGKGASYTYAHSIDVALVHGASISMAPAE